MEFYNITNDYISYIQKYDPKVAYNKNAQRPYIGIVLKIDNINYYAPFTSPKPKHRLMKNSLDFRKIGNGLYGAINFNNMIPVPDTALLRIDIKSIENIHYKRLLQNQYLAIQMDETAIIKTAKNLRELIIRENSSLSTYQLKVKNRCCNLILLEKISQQYEQNNI